MSDVAQASRASKTKGMITATVMGTITDRGKVVAAKISIVSPFTESIVFVVILAAVIVSLQSQSHPSELVQQVVLPYALQQTPKKRARLCLNVKHKRLQ